MVVASTKRELCFLGAGALGTTEILLRSRAHGLKMSPMVGQKLSGNGDVLSFGTVESSHLDSPQKY